MIQNELLPGCAVIIDGKETIWLMGDYQVIQILSGIKPIPLTAETVARVECMIIAEQRESDIIYDFTYHDRGLIDRVLTVSIIGGNVMISIEHIALTPHITSIHQLQILIYSLTGEMPKYELR